MPTQWEFSDRIVVARVEYGRDGHEVVIRQRISTVARVFYNVLVDPKDGAPLWFFAQGLASLPEAIASACDYLGSRGYFENSLLVGQ